MFQSSESDIMTGKVVVKPFWTKSKNFKVFKDGRSVQHGSNSQSKIMRREEVTNQNNCEWF